MNSASLTVEKGKITALVGENGAGKSTLIKILTGALKADSGRIVFKGKPVVFNSPFQARKAGISTIYQEFTLIPELSVQANVFLGREKHRGRIIDFKYERERTKGILSSLNVNIDPDAKISTLSAAQQQIVEIARALLMDADILLMDEPTAALTPNETDNLFKLLNEFKAKKLGIVFISHKLDEVFLIADGITVMRDGETVGEYNIGEITREQLIEKMVGRTIEQEFPRNIRKPGKVILSVKNLYGGFIENVSFSVRRGEVLGIAGLMGAGRTETARLIFGADPKSSGEIRLDGNVIKIKSPRDAIKQGICLLTEDRKLQGIIPKASVKDNFALPNLQSWSKMSWIDGKKELKRFGLLSESLKIKISAPTQKIENLSGGNQQKALVARWIEKNSEVIIFDEPTRGIDVGAKYEIYLLIDELARQGKAIIVISSELPEIIGICDRILVMRGGKISGEIINDNSVTQEQVLALAV